MFVEIIKKEVIKMDWFMETIYMPTLLVLAFCGMIFAIVLIFYLLISYLRFRKEQRSEELAEQFEQSVVAVLKKQKDTIPQKRATKGTKRRAVSSRRVT
jgi:hypothetical protein